MTKSKHYPRACSDSRCFCQVPCSCIVRTAFTFLLINAVTFIVSITCVYCFFQCIISVNGRTLSAPFIGNKAITCENVLIYYTIYNLIYPIINRMWKAIFKSRLKDELPVKALQELSLAVQYSWVWSHWESHWHSNKTLLWLILKLIFRL